MGAPVASGGSMLTTHRARPWWHVGHRVLGDMFVAQRLHWCRTCGQEADYRKEFRYEGVIYAKKEWCARCGSVINWAVAGDGEEAVRERARTWATAREQDRR